MEIGSTGPCDLSDQSLHGKDQLVNVSEHLLEEESGLRYEQFCTAKMLQEIKISSWNTLAAAREFICGL